MSSPSGSIISPGYPAPYHHNAECTWEIHVAQGSKINFVFLDLDLETSANCGYDYVKLYDGSDQRSKVLGKYCHSSQEPIVSTGNSLVVVFRTDYSQAKFKWMSQKFKKNGILLPKLFWPTVRKNCSSDWQKLMKFKAEGQEFSKILRSLEQFI